LKGTPTSFSVHFSIQFVLRVASKKRSAVGDPIVGRNFTLTDTVMLTKYHFLGIVFDMQNYKIMFKKKYFLDVLFLALVKSGQSINSYIFFFLLNSHILFRLNITF
jgi:hypothetical protein